MTPKQDPTRRTLADGRQIFYFDDAGSARAHSARDSRELPALDHSSRMRFDVLTGGSGSPWLHIA